MVLTTRPLARGAGRPLGLAWLALACLSAPAVGGCEVQEAALDVASAGLPDPPPDPEPEAPVGDALALRSISPARGPVEGLTQVELVGAGFVSGLRVRFAESEAIDAFVLDANTLVALTPPRPAGVVDVAVFDPASGAEVLLEAAYRYDPALVVTGLEPAQDTLAGGAQVTLTGEGFDDATVVSFGERRAIATTVLDETTLVAIVPPSDVSGAVPVRLASARATVRLDDAFLYRDTPRLDRLDPALVGVGEPIAVTALGAGLASVPGLAQDDLTVALGPATIVDRAVTEGPDGRDQLALVAEPLFEPGVHALTAVTGAGAATLPGALRVLDPQQAMAPTVWGMAPSKGGVAGGTEVALAVSGLAAFGPAGALGVTLGGVPATVLSVDADARRLVVRTPAAAGDAPGGVAVVLEGPGASAEAPSPFTYAWTPRVTSVSPNHGAVQGGDTLVVRVTGVPFGVAQEMDDVVVFVGPMAATGLRWLGPGELEVTTPVGSAGPVDVRVRLGGEQAELPGGFVYHGDLDAWAVEPPTGSVAGGTLVTLHGSGFVAGMQVLIDDTPATEVVVLSPTRARLRTPAGDIGAAALRVVGPQGDTVEQHGAFTYYNPAAPYGTTWGAAIEDSLHVAVLEAQTAAPVAGAFVVVGDDPATALKGTTDEEGLLTLAAPGLRGPLTVTATAAGHMAATVHRFDARNLTLLVQREHDCSDDFNFDCGGGGSAAFVGTVVNPNKGVTMPFAPCETVLPSGPGVAPSEDALCQPCTVDADCDGLSCSPVPFGGGERACLPPCDVDGDCPGDYVCVPMIPEPGTTPDTPTQLGSRCLPSPGVPRTECRATHGGPAVGVDVTGTFVLDVTLGDFAIVCWSGTEKNGVFTPRRVGALRYQRAQSQGEVLEGTVMLDNTVNTSLDLFIDRAPEPPDVEQWLHTQVELWLDFEEEGGTFQWLRSDWRIGRDAVVARVPKALTGSLFGVKWGARAGMFHQLEMNGSSTLSLQPATGFGTDQALHLSSAGEVEPRQTGLPFTARDIAEFGEPGGLTGLLAVGDGGTIVQKVGAAWGWNGTPVSVDLHAVDARTTELGATAAIAVGANATALHYDGVVWQAKPLGDGDRAYTGVWMDDTTGRAWAVGGGRVAAFVPGEGWGTALMVDERLWDVVGLPDSDGAGGPTVWAVGDAGTLVRWTEATGWVEESALRDAMEAAYVDAFGEGGLALIEGTAGELRALAVAAASDAQGVAGAPRLFAVGVRGLVARQDVLGAWRVRLDATSEAFGGPSPAGDATLHAVWAGGVDDVWAVGDRGTVVRFDGAAWSARAGGHDGPIDLHRAPLYAVGGHAGDVWALGSDDLVLGPMLSIPTDLHPSTAHPDLADQVLQGIVSWDFDGWGSSDLLTVSIGSSKTCTVEACGMVGQISLPQDTWDIFARPSETMVPLPALMTMTTATNVAPGSKRFSVSVTDLRGSFDLDAFQQGNLVGSGGVRAQASNTTMVIR